MNFYIQYRIPLKTIPSNLNYLFSTYQNIEFDYVRNMIILYSLQSFDVRFDMQLSNEGIDDTHFRKKNISNLLIPCEPLTIITYPNEIKTIDNICNHVYFKNLIINRGMWYKYYSFLPGPKKEDLKLEFEKHFPYSLIRVNLFVIPINYCLSFIPYVHP